ncbi:hypothetical protein LWI28_007045 [Acer negundo]|uniref:Uncharacterized protein n=1 Tax=Acer negundo TaxID=4023 RepID=A0AAD5IKV4_ACENE|nr:hypothetical protein LWI28_007045 [Acer negundo]
MVPHRLRKVLKQMSNWQHLTFPQRFHLGDQYPSTRYYSDEYVVFTNMGEPECYVEALKDEHKNEWFEAMQDKMWSLHENHTYQRVTLPKGDNVEDGVKVMILKIVVFWVWFRRWWGFGLLGLDFLGLDHLVVFSNLHQWR